MMYNFKPVDNNVIVKTIVDSDKTSSGGLFIPDSAQDDTSIAEVIAVGPGIRSVTDPDKRGVMSVVPGDMIVIPKFVHKLEINNDTFYYVKENDIITILTKTN